MSIAGPQSDLPNNLTQTSSISLIFLKLPFGTLRMLKRVNFSPFAFARVVLGCLNLERQGNGSPGTLPNQRNGPRLKSASYVIQRTQPLGFCAGGSPAPKDILL